MFMGSGDSFEKCFYFGRGIKERLIVYVYVFILMDLFLFFGL